MSRTKFGETPICPLLYSAVPSKSTSFFGRELTTVEYVIIACGSLIVLFGCLLVIGCWQFEAVYSCLERCRLIKSSESEPKRLDFKPIPSKSDTNNDQGRTQTLKPHDSGASHTTTVTAQQHLKVNHIRNSVSRSQSRNLSVSRSNGRYHGSNSQVTMQHPIKVSSLYDDDGTAGARRSTYCTTISAQTVSPRIHSTRRNDRRMRSRSAMTTGSSAGNSCGNSENDVGRERMPSSWFQYQTQKRKSLDMTESNHSRSVRSHRSENTALTGITAMTSHVSVVTSPNGLKEHHRAWTQSVTATGGGTTNHIEYKHDVYSSPKSSPIGTEEVSVRSPSSKRRKPKKSPRNRRYIGQNEQDGPSPRRRRSDQSRNRFKTPSKSPRKTKGTNKRKSPRKTKQGRNGSSEYRKVNNNKRKGRKGNIDDMYRSPRMKDGGYSRTRSKRYSRRNEDEETEYSDSSRRYDDETDSSGYTTSATASEAETAFTALTGAQSAVSAVSQSASTDSSTESTSDSTGSDTSTSEDEPRDGVQETNYTQYMDNVDDMLVNMVIMMQQQPLNQRQVHNQSASSCSDSEEHRDGQRSDDDEQVTLRSDSPSHSPSHECYT